jgi:phosphopantetheinyl transferase
MDPAIVPPAEGQAVVFALQLRMDAPGGLEEHLQHLSADERLRAERFVVAAPREQFVLCRSGLRQLLATMLGTAPNAIEFRYDRAGKPNLRNNPSIHFNVSHSVDQAMIAFAHSPIGIDLEIPAPRVRLHTLAESVLSKPERAATRDLPPQQLDSLVLDLWVAKEALLKALGIGLAGGMQRITFQLPLSGDDWFAPGSIDSGLQLELQETGNCSRNSWLDPSTWKLRYLQAPASMGRAAIAVSRSVQHVVQREFSFGKQHL